jgi:hypothetical protein
MSIFVADLAFSGNSDFIFQAKIGILTASLFAGLFGYFWLRYVAKNSRTAILSLTAAHATPKIPSTFPTTSPAIIPIDMGCIMVSAMRSKSMAIPAFASANKGMMH